MNDIVRSDGEIENGNITLIHEANFIQKFVYLLPVPEAKQI